MSAINEEEIVACPRCRREYVAIVLRPHCSSPTCNWSQLPCASKHHDVRYVRLPKGQS